jgi:hypothetical protein
MRFLGLVLEDAVPDRQDLPYREALAKAAVKGWLDMKSWRR